MFFCDEEKVSRDEKRSVAFLITLTPNCWNEFDELKSVVVCTPSALHVPDKQTATDLRWEKTADSNKMRRCFTKMVDAMSNAGVQVVDYSTFLRDEERAFHEQLINRVFVRDLACVFGNHVIPGEAGTTMRRPEYIHAHKVFEQWFDEAHFSIHENDTANALENGDVFVLSKDAVFINVGMRSSYESAKALKDKLIPLGFTEIGVIDLPRRGDTMHLDMNLNIAGGGLALAKGYMRYFPVEILSAKGSTYVMMHEFLHRHGYEIIWTDEVKHTVADINFLNLDPETLLISTKAHKKIFRHERLKKKRLIEVDVDELEAGGGGLRCMTLPIERRS
ncbi:arginine deiminase [Halobacillus aidingensis]|uniref:Arginine deiminase n=1 Tax=Halobacillus aidingensis TaxID=240303 RepID=A0A1H0HT24_HALAD|nr:arginine deiminase [Halobacillus aidingensis]